MRHSELRADRVGSNTRVFALESRRRDDVEVQTIMEHALHDI
jgi:hypothetical protein